jgi:hypothetical protein
VQQASTLSFSSLLIAERQQKNGVSANYSSHNGVSLNMESTGGRRAGPVSLSTVNNHNNNDDNNESVCSSAFSSRPKCRFDAQRAMRQTNSEKSRAAKKRVIKMLFMIVIEFFVFWTPTYVIYTWVIFDRQSAHKHIAPWLKILFHLLSYVSACCNPITYCFMNKKFRQGFLAAFRSCFRRRGQYVYASRRSDYSFSGHAASSRTGVSQVNSTYDKIRDSDDISEKSF